MRGELVYINQIPLSVFFLKPHPVRYAKQLDRQVLLGNHQLPFPIQFARKILTLLRNKRGVCLRWRVKRQAKSMPLFQSSGMTHNSQHPNVPSQVPSKDVGAHQQKFYLKQLLATSMIFAPDDF